ncbi:Putative intracellular protease/amidase [Halobacillus karajensis]|uniref:Molecular chaperone Hsp31 and glyoxalase 3 n=1 Tax=Halobacillus karajensis TaxID=195088 RepID=A0A024P8V3_9BACI|nr:type 1 glutamine amidotransferase domain-containing protein [Halobacillus karajensis]CDQ21430.1 Molecular chaperone Hsp31 and glyoxalase 3 [Halobacillus karajensis]CDQ25365.1 Molecular chaperone Hsp31 and glyoxalase 3 [Halobacillus karajensis]CDQ29689.1 Molecular chaperone Hsp31 and glyoxalase 3 [Halobacillus karajensis]SEI07525.1 Putative intracellular protease/amidase [Halobacillus karajensis]
MSKKVLMVVTNHEKVTDEQPTGIWLSEFGEAYNEFKKYGYDITVASPQGGRAPIDPGSVSEDEPQEILDTKPHLENTTSIAAVKAEDYDAIFLPGGHGTMFDFPNNEDLQKLLRQFYEADKIIAAVCHGPAGLVGATLSNGEPLVKGKRVNAFTDAEEVETTLDQHMPFLLESKLNELGATFVSGPNWSEYYEVDGNLITGQNPQSTEAVAKEVVKQLD